MSDKLPAKDTEEHERFISLNLEELQDEIFTQGKYESDRSFKARKKYPLYIWNGMPEPKCSELKFLQLFSIDESIPSAIQRMHFGLSRGCIETWQEEEKGNKGKNCSLDCDSFNNRHASQ